MSGPVLPDINTMIAMGIDPKTGLPKKLGRGNSLEYDMKPEIKKNLRIIDELDAINRFKWNGLPTGLNSNLLERILYYRGKASLFKILDKFYFLPYALDGTIDVYGRYLGITPLPFGGGKADAGKEKPWIQGLIKQPVYDLPIDKPDPDSQCVCLYDYTPQYSQEIIARYLLSEAWLEVESDMIPFCRTALLNSTGITGIRVQTEDEQSNVDAASRAINRAALFGQKFIPIIGTIDFLSITNDSVAKADDFLMTMQSIDNLRLSAHGLTNGGIFQKKAHVLQDEEDLNKSKVGLVMQDCLENRKRFCEVANELFGLSISVDVNELPEDETPEGEEKAESEVITESKEEVTEDV